MAVEAIGHAHGSHFDFVHLINPPVAIDTSDAALRVNSVIKISVVGQFLNSHPRNRQSSRGAQTHRIEAQIILQHLTVAIQARRSGGQIGGSRFLDAIVAVTAVHLQLCAMSFVRKRDRLDRLVRGLRVFRGEIVTDGAHSASTHNQRGQREFARQRVGPFWKNIGHEGALRTVAMNARDYALSAAWCKAAE